MQQQLRSDFGSNYRKYNPFTTGSNKRQYDRMSGIFADLLRGSGSGGYLLYVDFTGRLGWNFHHQQY
jgi:hypothetical protein